MQVCIVLCVSCIAERKSPSSLPPEARGAVDAITRGKKAKKQLFTQAREGGRKKGKKFDVSQFHAT
ncbi:hypothetical protein AHX05_02800 [Salmonella enterica subsp. indica]|nr:hypothetical protein [Salmonella enterica subsp. indica]